MIKSPCKNCERKGCGAYHSKCKDYAAFIERNHERLQAQYKESTSSTLKAAQVLNMPKALKRK